jgi:hypothetical protein
MMRISTARFREAGSFIAGILIGLSIMVLVFALAGDLTDWQMWLLSGAPIILALGITLHVIMIAKARHLRTINIAPGWHAVRRLTPDYNPSQPGGRIDRASWRADRGCSGSTTH